MPPLPPPSPPSWPPPPWPPPSPQPPVLNSDKTVRAGSSSTCWPSISAKLSVSDIKSSLGSPVRRKQRTSSTAVSIRLIATMAGRRSFDKMH
ncbi:MAG: hypothetical protein DLM61_25415 [Pseudonocardiales bacterium]|nr:MAG: hypothetical protein DLM61_25415 [Pseudonocardiales bacterium]